MEKKMVPKVRLETGLKTCLAVFASLLLASSAQALGTASDEDIDNMASVTYDLAGTTQTAIESSPLGNSTPGGGAVTTFKVDNKIDFTVTELNGVLTPVAPGSVAQAVSYTLQNDGNTVQDFTFSASDLSTGVALGVPFGVNDDFDGTAPGIFVEDGTTVGYQAAEDTATFVDELADDDSVIVHVVRTIDVGQLDSEVSGVILTVQVAQGGAAGVVPGADITSDDRLVADLPGTVQIVFAEGAGDEAGDIGRDGKHSDTGGYVVVTATLEITKVSSVVWDPFSLFVNPKAIPGAIIEYTITVENTGGSGTATNVTVTDDLSGEAGNIAFDLDGFASGEGLEVEAPNLYGGAATSLTNGSGDDEGTWDAGTSTLTVNGISVDPVNTTASVKYRVTIQ